MSPLWAMALILPKRQASRSGRGAEAKQLRNLRRVSCVQSKWKLQWPLRGHGGDRSAVILWLDRPVATVGVGMLDELGFHPSGLW